MCLLCENENYHSTNCSIYCKTITSISSLWEDLQELEIIDAPLLSDFRFPKNLRVLKLYNLHQLEFLLELPKNLEVLEIYNCTNLISICKLPSTLKKLECGYLSNFTHFPKLREGLTYLYCSHCPKVKKFGDLPDTLESLHYKSSPNIKVCEEDEKILEQPEFFLTVDGYVKIIKEIKKDDLIGGNLTLQTMEEIEDEIERIEELYYQNKD